MERGWRGSSEINRVVCDADQVGPAQLETWLRESGTYIRTVPPDNGKERAGDGN